MRWNLEAKNNKTYILSSASACLVSFRPKVELFGICGALTGTATGLAATGICGTGHTVTVSRLERLTRGHPRPRPLRHARCSPHAHAMQTAMHRP